MKSWFTPRGSVFLMIVTWPQLLMFTGTGATKSLTSAGNDDEARLFRNALPKASQLPDGKTPAAVRLMAVSPKVRAARLLGAFGAIGSVTASRLLTAPIESALFRFTWLPQQGRLLLEKHWLVEPVVTHLSSPRTGLPPPLLKSNVTSRSPAVRAIVCAPGLPRPGVVAWLISKSMLAEPRALVRSQARYRKLLLPPNSDAS